MPIQAIRFYFLFALIAFSISSCRKDDVEEEGNTLGTYVIGDWKIDSIHVSGDFQSPILNGEIEGTGFNITGNWTFSEDGTFDIKTYYNLDLSIAGNPMGYGTVDEAIAGTYVIKGPNSIELTYDGEVRIYTITNRRTNSFSALYSDPFDEPDGSSGVMRFEIGISR
jgi:hypothetical protein